MLQMQAKEDKDAQQLSEEREKRGYPGGPAVKNPPCNAGDVTPHAAEQLSPGCTHTYYKQSGDDIKYIRGNSLG